MTIYQIIQKVYQDWITEHTQKLVSQKYNKFEDFMRLMKPQNTWTSGDYESLSAISGIEVSSLKRIMGYKPSVRISEQNERKIAQYLGYGDKMEEFYKILLEKIYLYGK